MSPVFLVFHTEVTGIIGLKYTFYKNCGFSELTSVLFYHYFFELFCPVIIIKITVDEKAKLNPSWIFSTFQTFSFRFVLIIFSPVFAVSIELCLLNNTS